MGNILNTQSQSEAKDRSIFSRIPRESAASFRYGTDESASTCIFDRSRPAFAESAVSS